MPVRKIMKNGKVAVLVSYGYGAGWYSGNGNVKSLFDPDLVNLILLYEEDENCYDLVRRYADHVYPDAYNGGVGDLRVEWVKRGTIFRIHEYDGDETLVELEHEDYIKA